MTIAPVSVDTSEFNQYYTDAYGRRMIIFRATFGAHYPDHKFLHNANQAAKDYRAGTIDGAVCYLVWLQSATPAQHFKFFWQQFGNKAPSWLMGVMTDVETWRGTSYANHGNHSKDINALNAMNAHKLGSWHAAWWYGNAGDIAELYPSRDSRFLGIQAKYGSRISLDIKGAIGQQYSDGQAKWGVPKGYPISSAPFGHVDHNAFPGVKSFKELRAKSRPGEASDPQAARTLLPLGRKGRHRAGGPGRTGRMVPGERQAGVPKVRSQGQARHKPSCTLREAVMANPVKQRPTAVLGTAFSMALAICGYLFNQGIIPADFVKKWGWLIILGVAILTFFTLWFHVSPAVKLEEYVAEVEGGKLPDVDLQRIGEIVKEAIGELTGHDPYEGVVVGEAHPDTDRLAGVEVPDGMSAGAPE
jgi:hypothetical protein